MTEKIIIVIPTYNERQNLPKLVKEIFNLNLSNLSLIIIDDDSPDGTGQIADDLAKNHPLIVIHRPRKSGLGSAYQIGFIRALNEGADLICQMDADLSHNPKDIPRLIQVCREGADLAIGSRKIQGGKIIGWNWWRKFCSWGAMFFSRLILGLKTKDVTTGFRCYRRTTLEKINFQKIKSSGYAWQEEVIYRTEKEGLKIKEIPIIFIDRKFGMSKLGPLEIIEFLINIFKLKFSKNV
ncbi:MAG: polyprenol monophosphomannose synthase [Minisyncoccia bacterium]